ncbi:type III pantothenate kinase [Oscillospiraceae bacterium MB08-C2-2]|nr:type III pantothenate kinase [Oscillospiraceae bacterium MB08-C2-2]
MILAVDIGNTHIKVGAFDNERLVFVSRLQTNRLKTEDEYAANLVDIFRLNDCNSNQFDGAAISSVVPPLSTTIRSAVEKVIRSQRVYLVSPGIKTGLNIKIDNPSTLGSDLVCAAVSAQSRYSLPCIMISMGTATVITAIDREGYFRGGAITAGINISLEALSLNTSQLPHISLESVESIIGSNTVDSMKSGAIYGTASMLDGMIARFKLEVGEDASVVADGGLAQYIIPHCHEDIILDDALVLDGLRLIYKKNAK